jgi:solute:Na+ symporter, SSS family
MTTILPVLIYFAILLGIGFFAARKESSEDFLIANRNVHWLPLIATTSSGFIGGGVLVLATSWAFTYGFSVIWVFVGSAIGFLVLIAMGRKLKKMSDKERFYTISDYLYKTFDIKTGTLSSVILFIYFFLCLLLQFVSGGVILSFLLNIQYSYALFMIGGVILLYLYLSGFKAVIKTDFFQYLIMILLGLVILRIGTLGIQTVPEQQDLLAGMGGLGGTVAFLIIGIMMTVLAGDLWQRIYAARSGRHLTIGFAGAFPSVFLIGAVLISIGLWVRTNVPGAAPEEAFVIGLQQMLPPSLLWIGLLVVLSSIMSSADTFVFTMSINLSRDILFHLNKFSEERLVAYTRVGIFSLTIISILVALSTRDVSSVGLLIVAVLLPIGPAILGSFLMRIQNTAAFVSILFGSVITVVLTVMQNITEMTAVLPFAIALITLVIAQATTSVWRLLKR